MLRVVPYAAFHFATYEQFRKLLAKQVYGVDSTGKQMPPSLDLMAGSLAGGSAVLLTYPLDLVRTRLAYDSESGTAKSPWNILSINLNSLNTVAQVLL